MWILINKKRAKFSTHSDISENKPGSSAKEFRFRALTSLFLAALLAANMPVVFGATNGTWTFNTNSNTTDWGTTTNWSGGVIADGGGFANFSTVNLTTTNRNATLVSASRTVGRIDIGDTNNTNFFTIAGTNNLIFDNTANSANAQLNETVGSAGDKISAPIVLNSSLDITNASSTLAILTLSGGITAGTTGTKTITTSTGSVTISGAIGNGSGTVAIVQNGPGTLALTHTNTFTGGVTINAGIVQAGTATSLGAATSATLTFGSASTGKFQLNGNATTIVDLNTNATAGTTVIENANASAQTLTVNAANTDTYAGTIQDGTGGGALALTMGGAGSLTLSGGNTYSGLTTLSAGTLVMSGTNSSAGAVTLSGGILQLNNVTNGGLASGAFTLGNGTLQAINAARTLSNNITYTATSSGAVISGGQNTTLNGSFTESGGSRTLTSSITGGNSLTLGGNVFLSEATGTGRTLTINGTGLTTISGVISNFNGSGGTAGSLIYSGSSTLTLSNTNTYTGTTSVSGGGVISVSAIGNSGANGNLGAGTTVNLGSTTTGGTLVYTGTGETTNKVINLQAVGGGGGTLDQSGTGLLKFSADLTSSGISTKTLTLQGSSAGTGEFAGKIIDPSGTTTTSVLKQGTGTWALSGASTYTGGTTISGGVLQVAAAETAGTSGPLGKSGTVSFGGGTLQYSASNTFDYSLRFDTAASQQFKIDTNSQNVTFGTTLSSSGGSLAKSGVGILTLGASTSSSLSGGTSVSGGTLAVDGTLTSATTVASGGTLGGHGTITGATAIQSGGVLAPGDSGVGTLTVGGDLTLGGTTQMEIASASSYDEITLSGTHTITLGGVLNIYDPSPTPAVYDLFNYGSSTVSSLSNYSGVNIYFGTTSSPGSPTVLAQVGRTWTATSGANTYTFSDATGHLTVVPEPSSCGVAIALMLAGAVWVRRRKLS